MTFYRFFNLAGDNSKEATPDPIPNSEVKLFCVDGTARVTVWESRTSPAFFYELPPLPPIHEWRGGLKFFSSETKKWEVGSGKWEVGF